MFPAQISLTFRVNHINPTIIIRLLSHQVTKSCSKPMNLTKLFGAKIGNGISPSNLVSPVINPATSAGTSAGAGIALSSLPSSFPP